tara:strand:- start:656 stop:835 length:180 start_codon:yes stop_codon:yes gene_type:complete
MFKAGELVKRKQVSPKSMAVCVVVDKDEDNYTVYNNSLKCIQLVAIPVIEGLYSKVVVY